MRKVNIFDNVVELDKYIVVTLDGNYNISNNIDFVYADNLKSLSKAIDDCKESIITPLTRVVSSQIMEKGYDIFVQNKNEVICFSDLLDYNDDGVGSFGREIRYSQNWEKMLYSGCFNIEVPKV